MSNDVVFFDYRDGTPVRVVTDAQGEPRFVVADVMGILSLGNTTEALRSLDGDEFSSTEVVDSLGRKQQSYVVSEAGLYSLVLRSRKPEAKMFKRWVTHEVLPSIRRHGAYATPQVTDEWLANPDRMIEALTALKQEREARAVAEARVVELEPSARSWVHLASADGDFAVDEAAKILSRDPVISMGRGRLFDWMLAHGWAYRDQSGRLHAMQLRVNQGALVEKVNKPYWSDREGCLKTPAPTIRVTPKGLERLHRELGGSEPLNGGEVAA